MAQLTEFQGESQEEAQRFLQDKIQGIKHRKKHDYSKANPIIGVIANPEKLKSGYGAPKRAAPLNIGDTLQTTPVETQTVALSSITKPLETQGGITRPTSTLPASLYHQLAKYKNQLQSK